MLKYMRVLVIFAIPLFAAIAIWQVAAGETGFALVSLGAVGVACVELVVDRVTARTGSRIARGTIALEVDQRTALDLAAGALRRLVQDAEPVVDLKHMTAEIAVWPSRWTSGERVRVIARAIGTRSDLEIESQSAFPFFTNVERRRNRENVDLVIEALSAAPARRKEPPGGAD